MLKVTRKDFLEIKNILKLRFLDYFSMAETKVSKAETEECNQEDWSVFDKFGITAACSVTYFLEVNARFSLKGTTKASFRGKKTLKISVFRVLF